MLKVHAIEYKNKFDEIAILDLAAKLPEIPNFLEESRNLTKEFFQKCKRYIEDRIAPAEENETLQIIAKRNAQLEFTMVDMWNEIRRLNGRITQLENSRKSQ